MTMMIPTHRHTECSTLPPAVLQLRHLGQDEAGGPGRGGAGHHQRGSTAAKRGVRALHGDQAPDTAAGLGPGPG